jgi:hypothetical protein
MRPVPSIPRTAHSGVQQTEPGWGEGHALGAVPAARGRFCLYSTSWRSFTRSAFASFSSTSSATRPALRSRTLGKLSPTRPSPEAGGARRLRARACASLAALMQYLALSNGWQFDKPLTLLPLPTPARGTVRANDRSSRLLLRQKGRQELAATSRPRAIRHVLTESETTREGDDTCERMWFCVGCSQPAC